MPSQASRHDATLSLSNSEVWASAVAVRALRRRQHALLHSLLMAPWAEVPPV